MHCLRSVLFIIFICRRLSHIALFILNVSHLLLVCTDVGEKIALSRRVDKHWRLIGWGKIRNGVRVNPTVQE